MFLKAEGSWLYSTRLLKLRRRGVREPLLFILRAWQYALNECKDTAPEMDDESLSMMEETIQWDGDDGQLIEAFRAVGILEGNTFALWWDEGAGALNEGRKKAREKKARQRSEAAKRKRASGSGESGGGTNQMSPGTTPVSRGTPGGQERQHNATRPTGNTRGTHGNVPGDSSSVPGDIATVPGDNPGTSPIRVEKTREEKTRGEERRAPRRRAHEVPPVAIPPAPPARSLDTFAQHFGFPPPEAPPLPQAVKRSLLSWCKHGATGGAVRDVHDGPEMWAAHLAPEVGELLASGVSPDVFARAVDEHCGKPHGWGKTKHRAWRAFKGFLETARASQTVRPRASRPIRAPVTGMAFSTNAKEYPPVVELAGKASEPEVAF